VFIGAFAVIAVGLAGFIAVTAIRSSLQTKALTQVEELNRRYETLRFDIKEESKATDVQALLDDLSSFAQKQSGYAAARAYTLSANIYMDQARWDEAFTAWDKAASASAETYLQPVAFYNGAVAAEEQGNTAQAIELYTKAASAADFPAASRSQFAIGRLQEANGKDAALEAYKSLLSKWPDDQVWGNLAQSRIIALSSK
jgi:tetratricopeptide (TPR) repeat protein